MSSSQTPQVKRIPSIFLKPPTTPKPENRSIRYYHAMQHLVENKYYGAEMHPNKLQEIMKREGKKK